MWLIKRSVPKRPTRGQRLVSACMAARRLSSASGDQRLPDYLSTSEEHRDEIVPVLPIRIKDSDSSHTDLRSARYERQYRPEETQGARWWWSDQLAIVLVARWFDPGFGTVAAGNAHRAGSEPSMQSRNGRRGHSERVTGIGGEHRKVHGAHYQRSSDHADGRSTARYREDRHLPPSRFSTSRAGSSDQTKCPSGGVETS